MKLDLLMSTIRIRVRYLALALPLFALFTTVHAGCIRGSAGYGRYGIYGYGSRLQADEGPCTVHAEHEARGHEGYGGYRDGNCDDGDDTYDGYGGSSGDGSHVGP